MPKAGRPANWSRSTRTAAPIRRSSACAGNSNAAGLKALLLSGDESLRQFRTEDRAPRHRPRRRSGRPHSSAPATPAGTEESFTVQRDGSLIVAAPGGPMSLDGAGHGDAADAADRARAHQVRRRRFELPDPLADPVLDLRIKSATARVLFRQGRRLHPDHRRRRPPVHRLPVLFGAQARQGQGPSARRDDDAHADGRRAIRCPACIRNITTRTWSRWSRWCRTRAAGTTPSRSPARPNITTTSAIPATSTARTISTRALADKGVNAARRLDGDQLLLQHGDRRQRRSSSPTSRGRGRATMCCCGR